MHLTVGAFARRAVAAANKIDKAERFGRYKVFISDVIGAAAVSDQYLSQLTGKEFGEYLIQAHRAGLIQLTRADLVPAMNKNKVRESQVKYMNATFHFLVLPE